MIFVSVGTQLPFPRLIELMEKWTQLNDSQKVFCQTAGDASKIAIDSKDFMSAAEFKGYFAKADVIVSHAGMGNILTALEMGKPIVILAREARLKEHRNDHQVSTANKFLNHPSVFVIKDYQTLDESIVNILQAKTLVSKDIKSSESKALNKFLMESVNEWF